MIRVWKVSWLVAFNCSLILSVTFRITKIVLLDFIFYSIENYQVCDTNTLAFHIDHQFFLLKKTAKRFYWSSWKANFIERCHRDSESKLRYPKNILAIAVVEDAADTIYRSIHGAGRAWWYHRTSYWKGRLDLWFMML